MPDPQALAPSALAPPVLASPVLSAPASSSLIDVTTVGDLVRLLVVCAVLTLVATAIHHWGRLGHTRDTLVAAGRATIQLGIIGLVIAAILDNWALTCAFLVLMVVVAARTASTRAFGKGGSWWPLLPVVLGAAPVVAVLLGSGLVPLTPIAVVPVAGILVGNSMTAATLCARRAMGALSDRRGEFEAGLSLGLLDRDAALLVAREESALALVPGLDQTRTVGLVTLPGAFVGTLLGGATPVAAAAVQLVVLVGLLQAQATSVLVMLELIARGRVGHYGTPA